VACGHRRCLVRRQYQPAGKCRQTPLITIPGKTRVQAEIDNVQNYFNSFYKNNPPEPNANRFSTICDSMGPDGTVSGCDPANGHNSYTVNSAMCSYVSVYNDGGATTSDIRQEAMEEAVSTTVENDRYFQESLGVYSMLSCQATSRIR